MPLMTLDIWADDTRCAHCGHRFQPKDGSGFQCADVTACWQREQANIGR